MTRVLNLKTGEYELLTDEEFARLAEAEPLTREQCIERLTAAGYVPANWALTSFETVELNRLREYVEALEEN